VSLTPTAVSPDGAGAATAFALHRPRGWRGAAGKYAALFTTNLREQLAYAGEMALRTVFLVMILYIFMRLWQATYAAQGATTIAGLTVAQMIWYLAFTETLTLSRPTVSRVVDEEIRSGSIAYLLVRPYAYAAYRLVLALSERLLRLVTTLVVASGLALLYVGPVPLSALDLPAVLAAVCLAVALDFAGSFAIGLLAFWLENTSSVELIYSRVVMLLGGLLLPLEVFPEPLQSIARALPFGTMLHAPARLALGSAPEPVPQLLARQVCWLAVAVLVVALLHRAAMRRVTVNGG
jgi:ABC-2 type transport system permease protein